MLAQTLKHTEKRQYFNQDFTRLKSVFDIPFSNYGANDNTLNTFEDGDKSLNTLLDRDPSDTLFCYNDTNLEEIKNNFKNPPVFPNESKNRSK